MDQKFFRIPFASNGDKQAVPDDKTADGYVSFTEGWGTDYEKDLYSNAHAKAVEHNAMNGVLNAITVALRQYQTDAFPEWSFRRITVGRRILTVLASLYATDSFISYVSLAETTPLNPVQMRRNGRLLSIAG